MSGIHILIHNKKIFVFDVWRIYCGSGKRWDSTYFSFTDEFSNVDIRCEIKVPKKKNSKLPRMVQ